MAISRRTNKAYKAALARQKKNARSRVVYRANKAPAKKTGSSKRVAYTDYGFGQRRLDERQAPRITYGQRWASKPAAYGSYFTGTPYQWGAYPGWIPTSISTYRGTQKSELKSMKKTKKATKTGSRSTQPAISKARSQAPGGRVTYPQTAPYWTNYYPPQGSVNLERIPIPLPEYPEEEEYAAIGSSYYPYYPSGGGSVGGGSYDFPLVGSSPAQGQRARYRPVQANIPRWLQGVTTWRGLNT